MGALMVVITGSEGGGNYDRLKRGVIGGPLGLHGAGEGGGGIHGVTA
jgi:hypothetical protein